MLVQVVHWEKSEYIWHDAHMSNAKPILLKLQCLSRCCWNRCAHFTHEVPLGKLGKSELKPSPFFQVAVHFLYSSNVRQERISANVPLPFSKLSTLPTLLSDKGEAKVEKEGKFITIYIIQCLFRFTKVTKTITFHVALDKSIASMVSLSVKCANSWIYFIGCLNH